MDNEYLLELIKELTSQVDGLRIQLKEIKENIPDNLKRKLSDINSKLEDLESSVDDLQNP